MFANLLHSDLWAISTALFSKALRDEVLKLVVERFLFAVTNGVLNKVIFIRGFGFVPHGVIAPFRMFAIRFLAR